MLKKRFFKLFTIIILVASLIIYFNLDIPISYAQNYIPTLTSSITTLQTDFNNFRNNDLENLQTKLNNQFQSNEDSKANGRKIEAGIRLEEKDSTFKDVYTSFQEIIEQRQIVEANIQTALDGINNLKEEEKTKLEQLNIFLEDTKKNGSEYIFSSIDQLEIIINPLKDDIMSPEKLCGIQGKLGITDQNSLTTEYEPSNQQDTCGYFREKTNTAIQNKLNVETSILSTDIQNAIDIINDNNITIVPTEAEVPPTIKEQIIKYIKKYLLIIVILAIVGGIVFWLWKIKIIYGFYQKLTENTSNTANEATGLENEEKNSYTTSSNQERMYQETNSIPYQLNQVSNISHIETRINNIEDKLDLLISNLPQGNENTTNSQTLERENESLKIKNDQLREENEKLNQQINKLKEQNATLTEKSTQSSFSPRDNLLPQSRSRKREENHQSSQSRSAKKVSLTDTTINNVWKGVTERIEFQLYDNGEYLIKKGDGVTDDLFLNPDSLITPEAMQMWKKAKLFSVKGNTNSKDLQVATNTPAKVIESGSGWVLREPGEVIFA